MATSGCNDINIHDTDQLQCGRAPVPHGIPTEGGTPLVFSRFITLYWQVPRQCLGGTGDMSYCTLAKTINE